jgi:hypothetical protein
MTGGATAGGSSGSGTGGPTQTSGTIDLTGFWRDNNCASYSVRQIGNKVSWWMDDRPQVTNVFEGTIDGNTLTGKWVDLPGGKLRGNGTLKLRIDSNDRLTKIDDSPYGATTWNRREVPADGP